jgi:hypothetical protein
MQDPKQDLEPDPEPPRIRKKTISDPPHCNWVRQNCAKAECELQVFHLIEYSTYLILILPDTFHTYTRVSMSLNKPYWYLL